MTESEQLTEGSYVYTDLGIEQVHWCEVNGEKELVTPKGYILGDVPSYYQEARTVKENFILIQRNAELRGLLKECREHLITYKRDDLDKGYVVYDGSYLIGKIKQVLGDK